MRYLKSYQLFEMDQPTEDPIDVQDAPAEDTALDTQNQQTKDGAIKVLEAQLKEYNSKKSQIDQIYLNTKNDADIQAAVQKIIGTDPKKKNPFLLQYEQFLKDDRLLKRLNQAIIDDTAAIAKYQKELQGSTLLSRDTTDAAQQTKLQTSIKTTNDTIKKFQDNITLNKKAIPKLKLSVARKVEFMNSLKLKVDQVAKMKT